MGMHEYAGQYYAPMLANFQYMHGNSLFWQDIWQEFRYMISEHARSELCSDGFIFL
jgi:hypothetical protein